MTGEKDLGMKTPFEPLWDHGQIIGKKNTGGKRVKKKIVNSQGRGGNTMPKCIRKGRKVKRPPNEEPEGKKTLGTKNIRVSRPRWELLS